LFLNFTKVVVLIVRLQVFNLPKAEMEVEEEDEPEDHSTAVESSLKFQKKGKLQEKPEEQEKPKPKETKVKESKKEEIKAKEQKKPEKRKRTEEESQEMKRYIYMAGLLIALVGILLSLGMIFVFNGAMDVATDMLVDRIGSLEPILTDLENVVAQVESGSDSAKTSVSGLSEALIDGGNAIKDLGEEVSLLTLMGISSGSDLTSAGDKFISSGNSLSTLGTNFDGIKTEVTKMKGEISSQKSKISLMQKQIKEAFGGLKIGLILLAFGSMLMFVLLGLVCGAGLL